MTYLTKEQIADAIIDRIIPEEINHVKSLEREDMAMFHHSVGMEIRNDYGLWNEDNPLTMQWFEDHGKDNHIDENGVDCHPNHPDQVSGDILEMIWEKVQIL